MGLGVALDWWYLPFHISSTLKAALAPKEFSKFMRHLKMGQGRLSEGLRKKGNNYNVGLQILAEIGRGKRPTALMACA